MQEVINKFDSHADNQAKFKLPDRVTAKRFIFKLLYGATDYGFFTDPDFIDVGFSQEKWAEVIEKFYEKYKGIAAWHKQIIQEAQRYKRLEIPSGRYYPFEPEVKYGKIKWPITKIKNYPIQGFGADLVMLARIESKKRLKALPVDFVSTIHDSIVIDCEEQYLEEVANALLSSIQKVPQLCKEAFNYDFSLPLTAEVQYGNNKRDMQEFKFN